MATAGDVGPKVASCLGLRRTARAIGPILIDRFELIVVNLTDFVLEHALRERATG